MTAIIDATVTEASNQQVILEGTFDSNNLLHDLRIGNKVFLGDQHAIAGEVNADKSHICTLEEDLEDAEHEMAVLKNKVIDLEKERDALKEALENALGDVAALRATIHPLRGETEEAKAPEAQ